MPRKKKKPIIVGWDVAQWWNPCLSCARLWVQSSAQKSKPKKPQNENKTKTHNGENPFWCVCMHVYLHLGTYKYLRYICTS
jgi:hypothetical protein